MDLKKGLSYVATGFLFTLVNINLTFPRGTVNVTPDFIGWILLFLSFRLLGSYTEGKKYLSVISLIMMILSAAMWVMSIVKPELAVTAVKIVAGVLNAVYMFALFGCLERVAADHAPEKEPALRTLKILNLVLDIALFAVSLLANRLQPAVLVTAVTVLGIAALITAIVIAVTLYKLKKNVTEKLDKEEEAFE